MMEETQTSSASETSAASEISQYEQALAHLEQLQQQLDNLRTTIPSLVAPLTQPATSKAQMFAEIKNSAMYTTNSLQTFRASWISDESQQIFTRSKESLAKDGDLSKAGDVPPYGWSEK